MAKCMPHLPFSTRNLAEGPLGTAATLKIPINMVTVPINMITVPSHMVTVPSYSGVRFTTRCRALTAGLSLTLNLTTNSTISVSQPLYCLSLSCANLSLSLTLQISQWS